MQKREVKLINMMSAIIITYGMAAAYVRDERVLRLVWWFVVAGREALRDAGGRPVSRQGGVGGALVDVPVSQLEARGFAAQTHTAGRSQGKPAQGKTH